MQTIVIVNPAAEHAASASRLAPRLATLQGKRIGLVDNSKHHADLFLAELERLLTANCGIAGVVSHRKPNASVPMSDDALDDLADRCDAVVHAVAD
jgi:hypothetical protein